MSFPNKEERSKCWGARDTYWSCLDKHHIKDSPQETKEKEQGPCAEFRRIYENSCTAQWVKHFDRKRSYIQFKEKIEKEGIPSKGAHQCEIFQKRRVYQEIACFH